jgi:hypothetical protein
MTTRMTEERSCGADWAFKVSTVLCAVLDRRRRLYTKRKGWTLGATARGRGVRMHVNATWQQGCGSRGNTSHAPWHIRWRSGSLYSMVPLSS